MTLVNFHVGEFHYGHYVILDTHIPEDRCFLGEVSYSQPGTAVHRVSRDVGIVKKNPATLRPYKPDDHVESGCLSCTVGAQESHYLTLLNLHRDFIDDGPGLVSLDQIGGVKLHFLYF